MLMLCFKTQFGNEEKGEKVKGDGLNRGPFRLCQ